MRYCIRALRRSPGFTWVSVTTLAIGIAAMTCIFAVFDAVLLRPLPYGHQRQLLILHWLGHSRQPTIDISAPAFFLVKSRAHSFTSVSAVYPFDNGVNLSGIGSPVYVKALRVSSAFFQTLEAKPALGRDFYSDEDLPGAPRLVVISHRLWTQVFAGKPMVLGHTLDINNEKYTVIGIMPREFRSFPDADLWMPLQLSPLTADPGNNYRVIARLKSGVSEQQATDELKSLSAQYGLLHPSSIGNHSGTLILEPLHRFLVGHLRYRLAILLGAVIFLLLVAYTNLAAVLGVRAITRAHEIAVRLALGSSRTRLLRIFIIESLLLAVLGGIIGVVLAKEALPMVLSLAPPEIPSITTIRISWNVLSLVALTLSVGCVIFSLVPAPRILRIDLNGTLRQAPIAVTPGAGLRAAVSVLVSSQVALTFVLISGSALFLIAFLKLHSIPPGFNPDHVTVVQVSLASERYQTTGSTVRLLDDVLQRLDGFADVEAAASVNGLPLESGLNLPVRPADSAGSIVHAAKYQIVSPAYFRAMGIGMLEGRTFANGDDHVSTPVAIINESLARLWWPGQSPIGRSLRAGEELGTELTDSYREIVGVSSDIHEDGLERPAPPTIFVPTAQVPDGITAFANKLFLVSLVVRARTRSGTAGNVRNVLASANSDLPVASVRTLQEVVDQSLVYPRFYSIMTVTFAGFALLLTTIGLYGLMSYQTGQRVREIGIRIAVGARRWEIVSIIVGQAVKITILGIVPGIVTVFLVARFLQTMLYNVAVSIEPIVAAVVCLIGLVAVLTSLLVAFDAASIEPMAALRNE